MAWAPTATVWWRLRPALPSTFERFRLYSFHNVLAGQQRYWHHRMALSYVPVGLSALLAATHSRRWLLLAIATLAGRAGTRIHRHDEGRGWRWQLRPDRAAVVALLILSNDLATTLGWWQARYSLKAAERLRPLTPPASASPDV